MDKETRARLGLMIGTIVFLIAAYLQGYLR